MNARKYLAEALGTFVLVAGGSMSILAALRMDAPILAVVPFGFGLALLAAIFAFGGVSGGHFNPAVTLGALLDRRLGLVDAGAYVVAQVVGAIGASAFVLAIVDDRGLIAQTTNTLGRNVNPREGFAIEVVLTAIFLLVILVSTRRAPTHAPYAIPLTLVMIHLAGIPFSGASVNPARSLAPALMSGQLGPIWIYLTAPFVGAAIGWAIYRLFETGEAVTTPTD
ncbi:MAG TPA: aquaporin [Candidatus Limnocylindrales bacterium]|jgi:aquaporin Z|nr:aquaporin [Candidatus Limnocylindrales bacterium]